MGTQYETQYEGGQTPDHISSNRHQKLLFPPKINISSTVDITVDGIGR